MKIYAIMLNTVREAIRNRILYLLLIFALLLITSSAVISSLTVGSEEKIIKDLGLAAIAVLGVLMSVFIGVSLVSQELERKTIYTILTKPLSRSTFILGKYLGLLTTLLINVSIMAVFFIGFLYFWSGEWAPVLLEAVLLSYLEFMIITAFAILFSTFSSPFLSTVFSLLVFLVGHLTESLKLLKGRLDSAVGQSLCEFLYWVLPNLETFNIRADVVHGLSLSPTILFQTTVYGIVYSLALLSVAMLIFERKDFN